MDGRLKMSLKSQLLKVIVYNTSVSVSVKCQIDVRNRQNVEKFGFELDLFNFCCCECECESAYFNYLLKRGGCFHCGFEANEIINK